MPWSQSLLNLPWMTITKMEETDSVRVEVDYTGPVRCPHCTSARLRKKAPFVRRVRHEGRRPVRLVLRDDRGRCVEAGERDRFPGTVVGFPGDLCALGGSLGFSVLFLLRVPSCPSW